MIAASSTYMTPGSGERPSSYTFTDQSVLPVQNWEPLVSLPYLVAMGQFPRAQAAASIVGSSQVEHQLAVLP